MRRTNVLAIVCVLAGILIYAEPSGATTHLLSGMLLKGSGPEVFFIENGFKRWVKNVAAFNHFEFDWRKIRSVSDEELGQFPTGAELKAGDRYPEGALLREDARKGGDGQKVYLVKQGQRRWVQTPQDFENLGFVFESVFDVSPEKIKTVWEGGVLKQATKLRPPASVFTAVPMAVVEEPSVVFRFTGRNAGGAAAALEFDTFLAGVDTEWIRTSGQERTIRLREESGRYAFFLRARNPEGLAESMAQKATFEVRLSSGYGKIGIVSINTGTSDPQQESVTLEGRSKEPVTLTGWTLGSEKFNTRYAIPAAAPIPNHPGETKEPILLPEGGRVTVAVGKSPLGVSFRLNKCIGYLLEPQSNLCPRIEAEQIKDLSAYCRRVLENTQACRAPNIEDILLDNDCRAFINQNLNYYNCVLKHRPFYDFLRPEWRVYLELSREVWAPTNDAVVLRDPSGLVVSRWAY